MTYLFIGLALIVGTLIGLAIAALLSDSKARDRCHECRTAERMSMKGKE